MFLSFLTRVARFVRHPTSNWQPTEHTLGIQEEAYSKQLLKEMIERKRRNDFVRKREFDILRKMHKREALSGQELGVARPSFFHSSLPSTPDDRAVTLRKIDEIEAQMSMQWWKTNHGGIASTGSTSSSFSASLQANSESGQVSSPESLLDNALPGSYAATAPLPLGPKFSSSQAMSLETVNSKTTRSTTGADGARLTPTRPLALEALTAAGAGYDGATAGFTPSKLFAIEVAQIVHDPELEEASIYFSNGEDTQAEACLRDALGPQGSRANHVETWLTLFDLYRVTGQQEKFENLALDFVGCFGRSAPQWLCLPELVQSLRKAQNSFDTQPLNQAAAHWVCPPNLDKHALVILEAVLRQTPMPWCITWSDLNILEVDAIEPLRRLFDHWASQQTVQLQFWGQEQLLQVLKAQVQAQGRQAPQAGWQLLMQVLRVLHQPDDFELIALDFCVNYDVSPPAWGNAACTCTALDAHASSRSQTIIGDAYRDTVVEGRPSQSPPVCSVELSGQIKGDALTVLEQVEQKCAGAQILRLNCSHLIRVDFSAAGALLNWVAARQSEGQAVHFADVNRLVAAFFNTMGISAQAKVTVQSE